MAVDDKGREITGLKSALPQSVAALYGNKTKGGDNSLYDVLTDGNGDDDNAPAPATRQQPQAQVSSTPPKVVPPTQDPQQQTPPPPVAAADSIEEDEDTTAASPIESTVTDHDIDLTPGMTIEVDNAEYEFLTGLEKDDIITRMLAHRKGKTTLQSRLDKIKDIVGTDLVKALEEGEDVTPVKTLLHDLQDPALQSYIADFYTTHEKTDVGYKRVKGFIPTTDVFTTYTNLLTEKANLNVSQFLTEGDNFSADDALLNPHSPSGRALASYQSKQREIDTKLADLTKASTTTTPVPQQDPAAASRAWDSLRKRFPELVDKGKMTSFQSFVRDNINTPLEAFYSAFRAQESGTSKRRTLVLRELNTIDKNVQSAPNNINGMVSTGNNKKKDTVPGNVKPEDWERIKHDNDVFGDIVN